MVVGLGDEVQFLQAAADDSGSPIEFAWLTVVLDGADTLDWVFNAWTGATTPMRSLSRYRSQQV